MVIAIIGLVIVTMMVSGKTLGQTIKDFFFLE